MDTDCIAEKTRRLCSFVAVTYMSVLVEKVKSIQIHCQDAGRLDGGRATAVDVKEGRAEHGEGTDQTWRVRGEGKRNRILE